MEININAEWQVPLGRAGKYGTLTVDTGKFSPTVHEHVYAYGLRQILNDAIADKTDDDGKALDDDALVAKAQRRLDTLYSGELRVRREPDEPTDPVDAEMFRMVRGSLVEAAKKAPQWKAVPKGTKDRPLWVINTRRAANRLDPMDWPALVAKVLADDEAKAKRLRTAAIRIVKERAEAGEVEI